MLAAKPQKEPSLKGDTELVKGYRVRVGMADVQPQMGAIDFSYISSIVSAASAAKQCVGIGIAAGVSVPVEIFDMGVQKFTVSPDDVSIEKLSPDMPLPWDKTFQEFWFTLIDALGKEFESNPAVTYVVV
jgi:hypothetical protein